MHNNVTGDSAYVVVPATMTFTVHGKQVTQSGAVFTVALRKLAEGWRIAAWAWAKGTRFDVINQDNPMLELDDIQHFLLRALPRSAARYGFLTFRQPAGGRAWLSGIH